MTTRTIRLFDGSQPSTTHPAQSGESDFEFLARIDNPWFARVRETLEEWFGLVPSDVQPDVRARFRSGDDGTALGALWELYLHRLLTGLGSTLSFHPGLVGSRRSPDFRVVAGENSFFVEATVVHLSAVELGAERRTDQLKAVLNAMRVPRFDFGMLTSRIGPSAPPARRLRNELEAWAHQHDPDDVARLFAITGQLPTREWSHDGWRVDFSLVPLQEGARRDEGDRAIGVSSLPGGWIDEVTPLRRAIRTKAARYGSLDQPYVIAILSNRRYVTEGALTDALFGHEQSAISLYDGVPTAVRSRRKPDGLWHGPTGPRNRRVSGVLFVRKLTPCSLAAPDPTVWYNPWGLRPLPAQPLPAVTVDLTTGQLGR
jgi:hypothetical protein